MKDQTRISVKLSEEEITQIDKVQQEMTRRARAHVSRHAALLAIVRAGLDALDTPLAPKKERKNR